MTERQDPFEPRPETPETFVIRTPLTEAQETALVDWLTLLVTTHTAKFVDLLRAVGVRVESRAYIVGYLIENEEETKTALYSSSDDAQPLIRQSDHLAALAEKEAEVQRLRDALFGLLADWEDCMGADRPSPRADVARAILKGSAS